MELSFNVAQDFYNKLIAQADLHYKTSQDKRYEGLKESITGKSEAYEHAAEMFAESFTLNGVSLIKTTQTLRQQEIDKTYREEYQEEFTHSEIYEDVND